jgi:hypothetical protein
MKKIASLLLLASVFGCSSLPSTPMFGMRFQQPYPAFAGGGQIMIANTGANTAGTRTLDTQAMAFTQGSSTALATTMLNNPLYQHQTGDYPIILAANEGFIINNVTTMGAAGVINLTVNVEWFELAATTGNAIAY